jgi:dTDP-4-dehydrorhamnose reductase
MLGHQLCRLLPEGMEVWATFREQPKDFRFLPKERMLINVVVQDTAHIQQILDAVKPDAVVNAVGIVKQRDEAKQAVPSIQVNALFPHQLAELCVVRGVRVIQVSTDCVFSGRRGAYSESDVPDPVDLYGRSKLLGELDRPRCLTLRTSIIGWELTSYLGLLSWFAQHRGMHVKGYRKAIYSGLSTRAFSDLVRVVLETHTDLQGLYHVASAPISKFDLLVRLRDVLGWRDISIEPEEGFICDRSLNCQGFSTSTGWHAPEWEAMITGLAEEWPEYEGWYPRYPG